jgi:hypothetical protein
VLAVENLGEREVVNRVGASAVPIEVQKHVPLASSS